MIMSKPKHTVLYVPAETFPTHHSFMTEVYSKENCPVKTIFLMRTEGKVKRTGMVSWNKALIYLFPRYSRFTIINSVKTYFCIDIRYLYLMPYIILKKKITIIQVRDLTFPLLIALFFKLFFRKKVVYQKSFPHEYRKKENALSSRHKFPWLVRTTTLWENKSLHYFMRFCDAIFPISKRMAENLQTDYGLPAEKMYPLGLGFNFESISTKKYPQIPKMHHPVRLIYVGTLSNLREFDVLLHGLANVITTAPNRRIEIEFLGGTGQEVQILKGIAKDLNIHENCFFFGKIDRNEVYNKIIQSDIGISWFGKDIRFIDASPTKMIEYLSLGIPVIAVDTVQEHKKILNETNAGLCCMVDKNDFTRKLISIIDNYDIYRSCSTSAIEYMKKRYSYTSMRERIYHLYDNI